MRESLELALSPERVFRTLSLCIGVVLALHVAAHLADNVGLSRALSQQLIRAFDVDREANVPTLFSAVQLWVAGGATLLLASRSEERFERRHWIILSAGMFWMGVDEFAQLHEFVNQVFRPLVASSLPWLRFAWVVPATAVVMVLGVFFMRFLWRLPRPVARPLVLSGVVFVGGALGVETVSSAVESHFGHRNAVYSLCTMVEEGCEMMGIALYIRTCLAYAQLRWGALRLVRVA